jgi:hypothetical protein
MRALAFAPSDSNCVTFHSTKHGLGRPAIARFLHQLSSLIEVSSSTVTFEIHALTTALSEIAFA